MLMVAIRDEEDDMGLISNKKKTSIRNCFFFFSEKRKKHIAMAKRRIPIQFSEGKGNCKKGTCDIEIYCEVYKLSVRTSEFLLSIVFPHDFVG